MFHLRHQVQRPLHDPAQLGLIIAAWPIAKLLFEPLFGWWADRHARKPQMVAGILVLAKMLSDTYDELVTNSLNRLNALMGPVLLLFVAGIVVVVVLSVLLPLMNLTAAL